MVKDVNSEISDAFHHTTGPRIKRLEYARVLGAGMLLTIIGILLVIALDGKPVPAEGDDSGTLWQPLIIEVTLAVWWLLLPVLAMLIFDVRTRGRHGEPLHFGRLPGGRFVVAYAIWLFFTSMAFALVTVIFGALLSTPDDLDGFAGGVQEAFGWLLIRGALSLFFGLILSALLFGAAIVAHSVVTELRARRGQAEPGEVFRTRFVLGLAILLTLVLAYSVAVAGLDSPARMVVAVSSAVLIAALTAFLFGWGKRSARKAAETGDPDWTAGLVRTGMSRGRIIAGGVMLVLLLGLLILRELA